MAALQPVPSDAECEDWEIEVCPVIGHGYHDSHNPCPDRPAEHECRGLVRPSS